jgi:hypothetical protein
MSKLKLKTTYQLRATKELGIEKPEDLDRYLGEYYTVSVVVDEEGALMLKLKPKYSKYPEIEAYDIYPLLSHFRKLVGDIVAMELNLLKEKENF